MNRKKNQEKIVLTNYDSNINYKNMISIKNFEEPIDESEDIYFSQIKSQLEFNENIILEKNEEIQKIYNEVLIINDIFKDLNKLTIEQFEPISKIEEKIDETLKKTDNGLENIKKADEYNNTWFNRKNKLILLSIAGLSINVPITLTLGIKAGIISGLSTVGLSAITSLFTK